MLFFLDEQCSATPEVEGSEKDHEGKPKRKRSTTVSASKQGPVAAARKTLTVGSVGIFAVVEKSDSLLTFPDCFVKCVNSADFSSLTKLMKSRVNHRTCEMKMLKHVFDLTGFIKLFELMDELHPDQVLTVQSTKVVKNQIRAKIYYKFTESKLLRNAIAKSTNSPNLLQLCPTPQALVSRVVQNTVHQSDEDRQRFAELATNADEFLVYGTASMTITFDPCSKHITHFELNCGVTSYSDIPKED